MIRVGAYYFWLSAFPPRFSAALNIEVSAALPSPVSKVQLLREVEGGARLHKRYRWNSGKPQERSFGSEMLIPRVKRYDRNAWKSWKPGDSDPWADTQADYERQKNTERVDNRWRQESNRRHREGVARFNASFLF